MEERHTFGDPLHKDGAVLPVLDVQFPLSRGPFLWDKIPDLIAVDFQVGGFKGEFPSLFPEEVQGVEDLGAGAVRTTIPMTSQTPNHKDRCPHTVHLLDRTWYDAGLFSNHQ